MSYGRINQQWTTFAKTWNVINAYKQPPGSIAKLASVYLQGKHKPIYDKCSNVGDHVVVVNSKDISFSGNKWEEKQFFSSSGRPRGKLLMPAWKIHQLDPTWIIKRMVYRNLSKIPDQRRSVFLCLHVFPDEDLPEDILQNITNVIKSPKAITKSLSDYSEEEIKNFPKLFLRDDNFAQR